MSRPGVDERRLELFRRWHAEREGARGWRAQEMDVDIYHREFAMPQPTARELVGTLPAEPGEPGEVAGADEEAPRRLLVVTLFDETPNSLSAVYTFYDPAERHRSPGTLSILRLIELAKQRGRRWLYLGYRVNGCPSSEYKNRFRPHELARGWPDLEQPSPRWTAGDDGDPAASTASQSE